MKILFIKIKNFHKIVLRKVPSKFLIPKSLITDNLFSSYLGKWCAASKQLNIIFHNFVGIFQLQAPPFYKLTFHLIVSVNV